MVPVDLGHLEQLGKALDLAAQLAEGAESPISYVGVTMATPSRIARSPAAFAELLREFAEKESAERGIRTAAKAYTSHDLTTDLDQILLQAIRDTEADLVVMASHRPGFAEHIFASHAGHLASHAPVSVFVVR